jgi:hypothetical protein
MIRDRSTNPALFANKNMCGQFVFVFLSNWMKGDQLKEDGAGGLFNTEGRNEKYIQNFSRKI